MDNYVTLAVAISTCFIGIITSIIAYSQMKIASAKTKLDLYERRFNICITALNYYHAIYHLNNQEIDKCMFELIRSCRESIFLFKKEDSIYEILTEMLKRGQELVLYRNYAQEKKNLGSINPFINTIEKPHNFTKSLEDLEKRIKPYIQFENVKGWTLF